MESIKSTVWAVWDKYNKGFRYHLSDVDMSDSGWVKVQDCEITFETPVETELRKLAAKALRKEILGIQARAQFEIEGKEAEIQDMLALAAPKAD